MREGTGVGRGTQRQGPDLSEPTERGLLDGAVRRCPERNGAPGGAAPPAGLDAGRPVLRRSELPVGSASRAQVTTPGRPAPVSPGALGSPSPSALLPPSSRSSRPALPTAAPGGVS